MSQPALTLAWFALLLAVTFTIAFWVGRALGPEATGDEPAPTTPHTTTDRH